MNEPIEQRYALWDQFLERFPLEKIKSMSLEEYSQVGSKECFTWWVETGLEPQDMNDVQSFMWSALHAL